MLIIKKKKKKFFFKYFTNFKILSIVVMYSTIETLVVWLGLY